MSIRAAHERGPRERPCSRATVRRAVSPPSRSRSWVRAPIRRGSASSHNGGVLPGTAADADEGETRCCMACGEKKAAKMWRNRGASKGCRSSSHENTLPYGTPSGTATAVSHHSNLVRYSHSCAVLPHFCTYLYMLSCIANLIKCHVTSTTHTSAHLTLVASHACLR